jgi:uncharacterized protein
MSVAVISGTTSGLGREFVNAVMDECPDVDEIWMIARRRDRLESIAAEYPHMRFVCLPLDLAQDASYEMLKNELEARKPDVGVVIANAGVAGAGLVAQSQPESLERMIRLNAIGSTMLIRLCLPYMRRGTFIIQVSSVSAFAPNPNLTVYSATKAYASFFAAGLREELKPRGINVLRLNPGNMRTEMQSGVADHPDKAHGSTAAKLPFIDMAKFARIALRKARAGCASYTMHPVYKSYRVLAKLVPMRLLTPFSWG